MSRHDPKPRQGLGKEGSFQNEQRDRPASSLGSVKSRDPKRDESAEPVSTRESPIMAIGATIMPPASARLKELSARVIRDALAPESARPRTPPSWSSVPKIKDLL